MNYVNNVAKATFWEEQIRSCDESGLSAMKYCREHNLSKACFCYWKARLKKDGLEFKAKSHNRLREVGFARVVAAPAPTKELPFSSSGLVRVRVTEFDLSESELRLLIFGRN
jgi:hypothetical protein